MFLIRSPSPKLDYFPLQAIKKKKKTESFKSFISFDSQLNSACPWTLTTQHPTSLSGLSEVFTEWFDCINLCVSELKFHHTSTAAEHSGILSGTLLIFCSLTDWTCLEPIPSGDVNKAVHTGRRTKQIQDLYACVALNDCHAVLADVTCVAFGFEAGPENSSSIL